MSKGKLSKGEKENYIAIAGQLGYSDEVKDKILKAKTEYEVTRILSDARNNATFNRHKK